MTNEPSVPPLRELPPGRLAARRRHLLAEIGTRDGRPRRGARLVAAGAVAVAAGAAAGLALDLAGGSTPGSSDAPAARCLRAPQVFYGCSSFLGLPSWAAGTIGGGGDDQ